MMDTLLVTEAFESLNELGRENILKPLAEGLAATERIHGLHLRVPAFDTVFEVEGENADVDGLDDVFVELLETFELANLFFEPCVEAGVLQGDANVAGQRLEQFNVLAGEEVSAHGAAQADDSNRAAGCCTAFNLARSHAARQIVVQVQQGGGVLLFLRQVQGSLSVLEEDVGVVVGLVEVEEAEVEVLLSVAEFRGQAMRSGQAQARVFRVSSHEDGY